MKKNIFRIILIALLLKIVYLLFSIGIESHQGNTVSYSYETVIDIFKKNDTYWYERIALNGYPAINQDDTIGFHDGAEFKQSEWAFFPFYPFLINFTKKITGLSVNNSMLILSILFSLLAFILFYLFTAKLYNERSKSFLYTLLLIFFPFHYYFSVFYTEAIFLSIVIGSFYAALNQRYRIMSLLIIPLVLIRPNGVVILIPLYLFMLESEGLLIRYRFVIKDIFSTKNIIRSVYFLTGPITFLAYGIYQYYMTGEFFAFSVAQKGWYRDFMLPFLSFFRHGDLATQFDSIYTILVMLIAVVAWKKLPLSFNILVWLSLLLPLTSGSVLSMPRFISVIFPLTIFLGDYFYKLKYKWVLIGILFLLQLVSFYFWIEGSPLSF